VLPLDDDLGADEGVPGAGDELAYKHIFDGSLRRTQGILQRG